MPIDRAFCEWGLQGMEVLRGHVSVLIVVDVLSFSTAVDVAVGRGAEIVPYPSGDDVVARAAAEAADAVLAGPRNAADGRYSLSPASLVTIASGTRLMLPSPNGSRLSLAGGAAGVMAGCLRNAGSVARAALRLAGDGAIGVIPAGERWPDGSLRPAIEDLLGAGAILDALDRPMSPEARVAREAFRSAGSDIGVIVRGSVSGRELIERGFAGDVDIALAMGASQAAPLLTRGVYRSMTGPA